MSRPRSRTELVPSGIFPSRATWSCAPAGRTPDRSWRSGAAPTPTIITIDQGTFYLFTNGEELLSDAGHGSSYYANLYYPCYYTQAIGHNTMLVDGIAESQWPADYENGVAALRDYPRISTRFAGWNADEVEGDLTCVYAS